MVLVDIGRGRFPPFRCVSFVPPLHTLNDITDFHVVFDLIVQLTINAVLESGVVSVFHCVSLHDPCEKVRGVAPTSLIHIHLGMRSLRLFG